MKSQVSPTISSKRKHILSTVSSSLGNLIEWYDFYVYSFASVYFAAQFFPSQGNTVAELFKAAAVFFVGFLMRPVGSWLFGRIADKYGRKMSMLSSILIMCIGSLCIAFLPTYKSIGILAPLLLLLIRIAQGLSVGGEYGTAAAYMTEIASKNRVGFYSSFQYVSLIAGQLLASLVVFILSFSFSETDLKNWAWRIAFLFGGLLAGLTVFLRKSMQETISAEERQKAQENSLGTFFRNYKKTFFITTILAGCGSLSFYTFTTYMQKYLITTTGFPKPTATLIMTACLFVFMIAQPLFGMLSDKIGMRRMLMIWTALSICTVIPIMHFIAHAPTAMAAFLAILFMLGISSFYMSIGSAFKAVVYPPEIRALGAGLSHAVGNAILGGSVEAVALGLKKIGHPESFLYYVTFMMAVAFIAAYFMPKPYIKEQS